MNKPGLFYMNKIKTGIIGGAGYTGGELIRLLLHHPHAEIRFVHSNSQAGKPLHAVHGDLAGETDLRFTGDGQEGVDVLFLCVGHGEAKKFLQEHEIASGVKIIDLSQDFRLQAGGRLPAAGTHEFVYGLPELDKHAIRHAGNIANPGCFATAIQLGLLPLAKAGLLREIHTTGITGSTGAGQSLQASSHFSWRANNIQAYKTLTHQHLKEINQSLQQIAPGQDQHPAIYFVPWRGDFTRGIFVSSQLDCMLDEQEAVELYQNFYQEHPFTSITKEPLFLKQVVNTNKCLIQLEKVEGKLVVHSAIDNLLKGASGQAVQNMNLMTGLDETAGLKLKANYF